MINASKPEKQHTHTHCKWTENAREHTKKPIVYMCKHVFVFVLLHSGRLRRFVQRSNVCLMFAHRARLCFFLSALLHFSFRRVGCEHFFHSRTKDSVRSYHSLSHRCTCQLKSVIIGRQPNPVHFRLWKNLTNESEKLLHINKKLMQSFVLQI